MKPYKTEKITSYDQCEAFVRSFCADNVFSDPMLASDEQIRCNLIKAIEKPDNHAVRGVFGEGEMVGLFSFLVLKEEKYLEMLVGLSRDEEAYHAIMDYLKAEFSGYGADFVFNPNNFLLMECLRQRDAVFEPEQQRMYHKHFHPAADVFGVELLTEAYIPGYLEMHGTDMYWTGPKVIEARDRFRTFVAIEDGAVVGYLDVTCCFEENEPYDLLVKEEHRRKGFGRKLLAKALETNRPNGMALLVDTDNRGAIRLFESLGFEKAENENSLTAHLTI